MAFPTYPAALLFTVDTSGFFTLDDATDGRLDTGQLLGEYPETGWDSVTSRLYAFSCQHGREDERSGITAGTMDLALDDDDGALDPEYTSGTWYPNVRLNKRMRIQAVWAAVTYTLGMAFVDAYTPSRVGARGATVIVTGTDLFKRLERRPVVGSFPAQLSSERIGSMLDLINWPVDKRSLDTGHLQVPGVTLDGVSALQHIDAVVRAERGNFFIKGDGTATFHSRYYRQLVASRGTFGAGASLPVTILQGDYSEAGLANIVSVKLSDDSTYTVSDAASQIEHGDVPYTIPEDTATMLGEDQARQAFAVAILAAQAQPASRIKAVELNGQSDPTALYPHILGAEVGEKITLTHDLAGTRGLTAQDFFIERVAHGPVTVDDPTHRTVWSVSKAPTSMEYFRLDSATFGKLDTATLGF